MKELKFLILKEKIKKKKKKKMGSSVPPGSHVALVTSLQSNLIWKSSSVCFCWSYPWYICRTQASYCCRMFLSLDLSDVSLWLVWGYVFWAGTPQKWCCMLSMPCIVRHMMLICLNTSDVHFDHLVRVLSVVKFLLFSF